MVHIKERLQKAPLGTKVMQQVRKDTQEVSEKGRVYKAWITKTMMCSMEASLNVQWENVLRGRRCSEDTGAVTM